MQKKKMKNENDVAGSICATKWKERKGKKRNGMENGLCKASWIYSNNLNEKN